MKLYEEQAVATLAVRNAWEQVDNVLLVAPAGGGKTVMACDLSKDHERVSVVVHREELLWQMHALLVPLFGHHNIGVIKAGEHPRPNAKIQIGTVQSMLVRGGGDCDLLIIDEAHHYTASNWTKITTQITHTKRLGLTATTLRSDGGGLGGIFDKMVVAATYSDLLRLGRLVPAVVCRPDRSLGRDLAMEPVDAYVKYGGGGQAIVFAPRVDMAREWARRFMRAGIRAADVSYDTPRTQRAQRVERFKAGAIRVLLCHDTLAEGFDHPVSNIILARPFLSELPYVQSTGRGLRPDRLHPERKPFMTLIDLVGASCLHGLPTQDRAYSLALPVKSTSSPESANEHFEYEQSILNVAMEIVATPGTQLPKFSAKDNASFADVMSDMARSGGNASKAMLAFRTAHGRWPDYSEWKSCDNKG